MLPSVLQFIHQSLGLLRSFDISYTWEESPWQPLARCVGRFRARRIGDNLVEDKNKKGGPSEPAAKISSNELKKTLVPKTNLLDKESNTKESCQCGTCHHPRSTNFFRLCDELTMPARKPQYLSSFQLQDSKLQRWKVRYVLQKACNMKEEDESLVILFAG